MNLDRMKYFVAAASYLSVTKASRSVNISPSAVSDAIAKLEEEFECALFRRENKSLFLTEKGEILKREFEKIFNQLEQVKDSLSDGKVGLHGEFKIGGSTYLSSRQLVLSWTKLQMKHPGLKAELSGMHTSLIISDLLKGFLDFAVCFGSQQHPLLTQKELYQGNLRIVVSKKHPILKLGLNEQTQKIGKYPAIIYKSAVGVDSCKNHPILSEFSIRPHYQLHVDSDDQALACIESSELWALLPDICLAGQSKVLALPLVKNWKAPYSIYSVVRSDQTIHPALAVLEDELKKSFTRSLK